MHFAFCDGLVSHVNVSDQLLRARVSSLDKERGHVRAQGWNLWRHLIKHGVFFLLSYLHAVDQVDAGGCFDRNGLYSLISKLLSEVNREVVFVVHAHDLLFSFIQFDCSHHWQEVC